MKTITTKELRDLLPEVRAGLARGEAYTVIYRSRPIAQLQPIPASRPRVRFTGGGLHIQSKHRQKLTPDYLNQLAEQRYGSE